jgi:hypothetical protein
MQRSIAQFLSIKSYQSDRLHHPCSPPSGSERPSSLTGHPTPDPACARFLAQSSGKREKAGTQEGFCLLSFPFQNPSFPPSSFKLDVSSFRHLDSFSLSCTVNISLLSTGADISEVFRQHAFRPSLRDNTTKGPSYSRKHKGSTCAYRPQLTHKSNTVDAAVRPADADKRTNATPVSHSDWSLGSDKKRRTSFHRDPTPDAAPVFCSSHIC